MKFNITYMGDINFLNFQRDWLLLIAYGLQDLGHAVVISHNELDSGKTINIICHGVHNLAKDKVHHIINSNVNYGVIPGELIISRTINNRSQFDGESARVSTDFDNSYFIDELKNRNFYVADSSRSNYTRTPWSIYSTLNMDFFHP